MEFRQFDAYRKEYTHCNNHSKYCDVDYLLRFWRDAKSQYLLPMFDGKLILEKEIVYERSKEELVRQIEEMIADQREFLRNFSIKLVEVSGLAENPYECSNRNNIVRYLKGFPNMLAENTISLPHNVNYDPMTSFDLNLNGNTVHLQNGQKLTRVIGKICKILGLDQEWEHFRVLHSQVMNTRKLKGTLCLSIHPLDYATASDNLQDWNSCMSWMESGCYRLGTVEMMNSPMVICSYLKSDRNHMDIGGEEWNSKKWRAWCIVTKDAICVNRNYPYHSDFLAAEVVAWVKELCGQHFGWIYEEQIQNDFIGYMEEILGEDSKIEYHTNYMYNDIGDNDIVGVLRADHRNLPGYINFSGVAECMVCGRQIREGEQDADALECQDCNCDHRCDSCGAELDDDETYYDPDGNPLCYDCWRDVCGECDECGDNHWNEDLYKIEMPFYQDAAKEWLNKHPGDRLTSDIHAYVNTQIRWRNNYIHNDNNGICRRCLRQHGWWEHIDNNYVHQGNHLIVVDPTKVDRKEYLGTVEAYRYIRAVSHIDTPYATKEDPLWIDFWHNQYDAFIKDWKERDAE